MFGMGAGELILVLVIALLIFGPKKLPDLAKGIGKAMREFRRASSDLQEQLSVDHELGDAVREVQAAAAGAPSPAELQAARRAYDVEPPPTVPAAMPEAAASEAGAAPAESPELEAIKARAAATVAEASTTPPPLETTSTKPAAAPTPAAPDPAAPIPAAGETPAKA